MEFYLFNNDCNSLHLPFWGSVRLLFFNYYYYYLFNHTVCLPVNSFVIAVLPQHQQSVEIEVKFSSQSGSPLEVVPFHSTVRPKLVIPCPTCWFPVLLCKTVIKILIKTQMDLFNSIGNFVSIKQCRSIFS